ncbi:TIGR04222 domain-containing membrane protein [Fischerella sp. NIES-3754]|uniref:TIGR04222 domain-containing membrane protein n=1 Tax=Fischerella sp. NIES-3754 TaxID=1752063 RepID=UPI001E33D787|nr:TIGR04222 domain-containing membrane protein [Fischerella sp. NIES-3754]
MMNIEQAKLYTRIQEFSIDENDAIYPFSKKLAKENGWSAEYTKRAIEEYKKFAFLAVVAGHTVVPSEQVDQVWHLHLTYTHSYWDEFCAKVLQTPLHHNPTRGGSVELRKFQDLYIKTLASYERFFRQTPPLDIWPLPHIRFSIDTHFVQVNTQENWVLPKKLVKLPKISIARLSLRPTGNLSLIWLHLFSLGLIVANNQPALAASITNPLNLSGPDFLWFYFLTVIFTFVIARSLRWFLSISANSSGSESGSLNGYELAYLTGGAYRAVDAAIAKLVQDKYLTVSATRRTLQLENTLSANSHPLEKSIAEAITEESVSGTNYAPIETIRKRAISATNSIRRNLENQGLLVSDRQAKIIQCATAIPVLAVLLLGISKIFVGLSRGKPVGFLIGMCIVTAILAFFLLPKPHRTRFGDRTLNYYRSSYSPTSSDIAFGVALFGSAVLVGSLADLKQALVPPTTSSGDVTSGVGSSCGGGCGSGCGGGCGGCGG